MSTPPTAPPIPPRKQFLSALIWTVIAAVAAILILIRAGEPGNEKRNFYYIAGAVAVIATIMNGYSAWQAYQKMKSPPAP
jgi:branched-subunit amino acid transport protein